ncbi:unnamed protein product, partial [Didymodactylos carnosus]
MTRRTSVAFARQSTTIPQSTPILEIDDNEKQKILTLKIDRFVNELIDKIRIYNP